MNTTTQTRPIYNGLAVNPANDPPIVALAYIGLDEEEVLAKSREQFPDWEVAAFDFTLSPAAIHLEMETWLVEKGLTQPQAEKAAISILFNTAVAFLSTMNKSADHPPEIPPQLS